jgi:hypothetical protein
MTNPGSPSRAYRHTGGLSGASILASAVLSLVPAAYADASRDSCFNELSVGQSRFDSEWQQRGSTVERREIRQPLRGHPLLVRVEENGVDVEVQVLDGAGARVAQSDSPVERSAVQHLYLPGESGGATLVATANQPAGLEGTIGVTYLDADAALASSGTEVALPPYASGLRPTWPIHADGRLLPGVFLPPTQALHAQLSRPRQSRTRQR